MTLGLALLLGTICVLVIVSAFFSGSETALTAASRARMHTLERDGSKRAGLVNRLRAKPEKLIGAILLGNNLVNILASALATSLFLAVFGEAGIVYATLTMTALVLVFGEVMPKTYAISNPDRAALAVAPAIALIVALLGPVTYAVQMIVRFFFALFGPKVEEDAAVLSAHDELRSAIDLHHKDRAIIKHDRDMLGGVLDLTEMEVEDVMIHRTKMHAINADDPPEKIVDQALGSPYTRLPLWQGEPENIVGILHAKTLLQAVRDAGADLSKLDVLAIATEPWFVPDTTSLKAQLSAFLRRKRHFSLVVDEYGEVQGLVTLEDILEEIVGQITDEHDELESGIRSLPDGSVQVEGSVPTRDLNRAKDWDLPEEEATTVAGLVIHKAQTIPQPGQAFSFDGFRFEVLRRHRNKITSLRIAREKDKPAR
ncbi:MAG TPA: HlyC/CorC family transporter [Rhizobiales bacterium]|nr:magnesium and cobalt efflux protein CorC [bacterium BMS3Bbin10]HDO52381.1 HlyC/CorC family transporter [Hyphomicrobiales bacterium]